MSDLISRQAAIEVIDAVFPVDPMKSEYAQGIACGAALAKTYVEQLPSAQPERMTNRQWIDFLSAQFDISRTSAKEMLRGMMQWKKEDNFKKLSNGGQERS